MLKLGIIRTRDLGRPPRWFGRDRHASFLLLEHLATAGHADPAAYDTLIWKVRMPNGTWKQTAAGRLRLVDEALVAVLERTHPAGSRLSVLDLGASTGVTSVDLFESLSQRWSVDFTASDLYRDVFAVRARGGRWAIVFDAGGAVLQHVLGPFVLPGQLTESAVYPVNRGLKRWSEGVLVPRARAALAGDAAAGERPYFAPGAVDGLVIQRLPFFAFRCLDLMRRNSRFRFVIHDVTEPLAAPAAPATIVRALNIITREYFDLPTATRALGHAIRAVEPGGYLVAGQSKGVDPNAMRATIFRIGHGAAEVVTRVGEGYEMEDVVQREAAGGEWRQACQA